VGRDAKGLETTRQAIAGKGRRCVAIQADLRTVEGPRTAGTRAIEFLGTVDIRVNNAGVFHRESLLETTVEQWEETQAVNLRAPFLLAQLVAPGMMAQRRGKIINVSSLAAQVGCEGHAAYSSSKGGLNMLTRVMAAEWGPFNIQTNSVAPTVVLTDMGKKAWSDGGDERAPFPFTDSGCPWRLPTWFSSWPRRPRTSSAARSTSSTATTARCRTEVGNAVQIRLFLCPLPSAWPRRSPAIFMAMDLGAAAHRSDRE
jgi:NAD(P)-dependent dehydrogenase (short-subunit alcohol dehydrogenase family)